MKLRIVNNGRITRFVNTDLSTLCLSSSQFITVVIMQVISCIF